MMHRFAALAAVALMAYTSVASPGDAIETRLDRILARATEEGGKPGIAVAIQRGTQVIYSKGFGYADLEHRVPVTADTVFPIGSITKTMTGLAIAQLLAAGKIDLDAPAGKYVPGLPPPARDALVRHLLNHTSGLVNYTELPEFPRGAERPVTRAEVLGWFSSKPLQFEPGTRYNYTNSGTFLLGLIIEHVSGQTYEEYVRQNIFTSFGMQHTSMADWRVLVSHRAHGYQRGKTGWVNAPRYDPLVAFSAGSVMSTTGDMLEVSGGCICRHHDTRRRSRDLAPTRSPERRHARSLFAGLPGARYVGRASPDHAFGRYLRILCALLVLSGRRYLDRRADEQR